MALKTRRLATFSRLALAALSLLFSPSSAWSQLASGSVVPGSLVSGSMDVRWDEGAQDCTKNPQPPLQVHPYNSRTFVLRENLCATFEAPFMYLLVGSKKAMLVDTGDVANSNKMPLATTVMSLLPAEGTAKLGLLVVHTHRHLDHRQGDSQFAQFSDAQVVGYDLESVKRFYNFTDWPDGVAQIDLGDRIVDAIPTPGHNETEVSFYDRETGLFFSGDFLMPARLLVDDATVYWGSADRIANFVKDRPVSYVLGGHIELDSNGQLFQWQSQYHPNEHVLQLTKADLLALPAAMRSFNGFYTQSGSFVMMNSIHILILSAVVAGLVLLAAVWMLVRFLRRRRRARRLQAASPGATS